MIAVLVSDLHLTDKPADEYRWLVFQQLTALCNKWQAEYVFILGDLTDAKDYHSSVLVNKVVDRLWMLFKQTPTLKFIYILRGNHDGLDPDTPYFLFLSTIPNIRFIHQPLDFTLGTSPGMRRFLALPHSRTPEREWGALIKDTAPLVDYVLVHATLSGSEAESGIKLAGVRADFFDGVGATILAGDVHVPQQIGNLDYVGAPYHVRFGDKFKPRAVVINATSKKDSLISEPLVNISKHMVTVSSVDELHAIMEKTASSGDQLKVRLSLARAEFNDWQRLKSEIVEYCQEAMLDLHGIALLRRERPRIKSNDAKSAEPTQKDPLVILTAYCKQQNLDDLTTDVGKELLEEK